MMVPVVAPLLLVSCSTVPPLTPPSGFIAGIPVEKSKIVMPHVQEVKLSPINSNVLPAGEYRPVSEDSTGVYYQAPAAIIYRETFFSAQLPEQAFVGGIYLERANPRMAKIYEKQTAERGPHHSILLWAVKFSRSGFAPTEPINFKLTR